MFFLSFNLSLGLRGMAAVAVADQGSLYFHRRMRKWERHGAGIRERSAG